MIRRHGDNDIARAHLRAAELRDLGEQDAADIWMHVKVMIERVLVQSSDTLVNRQLEDLGL
jgi:hypothetical protein